MQADAVKGRVKALLHSRFEIAHSTLEMECAPNACTGVARFGHDGAR